MDVALDYIGDHNGSMYRHTNGRLYGTVCDSWTTDQVERV